MAAAREFLGRRALLLRRRMVVVVVVALVAPSPVPARKGHRMCFYLSVLTQGGGSLEGAYGGPGEDGR